MNRNTRQSEWHHLQQNNIQETYQPKVIDMYKEMIAYTDIMSKTQEKIHSIFTLLMTWTHKT